MKAFWGNWSKWTECTAQCGPDNISSRQRYCMQHNDKETCQGKGTAKIIFWVFPLIKTKQPLNSVYAHKRPTAPLLTIGLISVAIKTIRMYSATDTTGPTMMSAWVAMAVSWFVSPTVANISTRHRLLMGHHVRLGGIQISVRAQSCTVISNVWTWNRLNFETELKGSAWMASV